MLKQPFRPLNIELGSDKVRAHTENPFGDSQGGAVILANAGNALQENGKHAEKNQDEKNKVEKAARKGVMSKDDLVPFIAPRGAANPGNP